MPEWTRQRAADLADRLAGLVPAPGAISVAIGWPDRQPVTATARAGPDTRFLSCSSCKPLTAAVVLVAAERGLLSLDDSAHELAAGLPVRRLLSHTSGLAGDVYDWPPEAGVPDPVRAAVERDVPRLPRLPPGHYWYSNVGYQLLGLAVADACGAGFAEVARRLVLDPLGLVRSAYGDPLDGAGVAPPLDLGSRTVDEGFVVNPAQLPAGGLVTTPADLVRFATALVAGRLLGGDSIRLMTEPATRLAGPEHPAAGWTVRHDRGRRLLTTGGGYGSYGASAAVDLDTGQAVWALFNHPAGYALDVAGLLDGVGPPGPDPLARTTTPPAPGAYVNPFGGLLQIDATGRTTINGRTPTAGPDLCRTRRLGAVQRDTDRDRIDALPAHRSSAAGPDVSGTAAGTSRRSTSWTWRSTRRACTPANAARCRSCRSTAPAGQPTSA